MLETIMDQPYEQLLTERLFKPLGMKSAGFRSPATNGKVDQPYGHTKKLFMVLPVDPEPTGDNPPAIAPAGAVHCSITDFARYAAFHLGEGSSPIFSQDGLDILHEREGSFEFAKGWKVVDRKWAEGKAFMHTGSNTLFYAVIWIAPGRKFAAVALCNYGGPEGFEECDEAIAFLIKKHL
ncbi:MAG: penicillin-binding protein beta-lactamase class [Rariglobus sp.]|nr:penicillin-binding protein beta-lactamase class [Rariglobus sp.]